ncbi:DVU_1553 family AMP-dependent CoA ligase [Desulfosporosinus sp. SB140]|uniref:DVU_1553 family AMP-dependent CoA ligase n=1 Tax=Desulfosporosinus paludis TaxID=3115649 RepID=UPI00388E6FCF
MGIKTTSLEPWIKRKISGDSSGENSGVLTRKQIEDYQLGKLQETLEWVSSNSRFYQRLYSGLDCKISTLQDVSKLPFTTSEDVKEDPLDFLCVSQNDINRIVTLQSSGTTGKPKRLFFTEADQELTIDFFHHGMLTLVKPGDRVLILLPGEIRGSVGDLLRLGLERAGVTGIVHGLVTNPELTLEQIKRENINGLVGIPTQVLSLARFKDSKGSSPSLTIKSVLLSTDYVPLAIVKELKELWGCQVFNHYGMTEMGLGGGLECEGFCGYHLREADLYIEIIDPSSGLPVTDGQLGEIVLTTLTRSAMPLIRYRTGDLSRFISGPCACHTVLKRLELIKSRDRVYLTQTAYLSMADFDEVLFDLDKVLNFEVTLTEGGSEKESHLHLAVQLKDSVSLETERRVLQAVDKIPVVLAARQNGSLKVFLNFVSSPEIISRKGPAKRQIRDKRGSVKSVGRARGQTG